MKWLVSVALIAVFCAGCNSEPRLAATECFKSSDDAFFIIAVDPPNAMIDVDDGEIKDQQFSVMRTGRQPYMNISDGGFIVGKTKGNGPLGISWVKFLAGETAYSGGPMFVACRTNTVVFRAKPGKVVFAGSLSFSHDGRRAAFHAAPGNIDAARKYLISNYPLLADKLEPTEIEERVGDGGCGI